MAESPRVVRTWSHSWPDPEDPLSQHSATLFENDQPVASGEGPDWMSAFRNLLEELRRRGLDRDNVLDFAALARLDPRRG